MPGSSENDAFEEVASINDVADGASIAVEAHGHRVAVFRRGEKLYAIGGRCPHAGGPLEDGYVKDDIVICPWHASRFELATGKAVGGPTPEDVPVFPVEVEGQKILIGKPPAGTKAPPPSMF